MAERLIDHTDVPMACAWPQDCYVQGGDGGLVLPKGSLSKFLNGEPVNTEGAYFTSFVEAFPINPDTFIRGEGATIAEAEQQAWARYQQYLSCPGSTGHEFEARGYRNGAGFCMHCGMFASKVFTPEQLGLYCATCGVPTFWSEVDGKTYCRDHKPKEKYDA